jgi:geranylgeranyl diphosphate synthase type 3
MNFLFVTEAGELFTLGMQLMQLFSENKDNFTKLTDILGLYYQIWDDYHNLCKKQVNSELLFPIFESVHVLKLHAVKV